MNRDDVEALIIELQAVRTQAEALRWRTRIYLAVVQQNRQRLAREVARARRGWELRSGGDSHEYSG